MFLFGFYFLFFRDVFVFIFFGFVRVRDVCLGVGEGKERGYKEW